MDTGRNEPVFANRFSLDAVRACAERSVRRSCPYAQDGQEGGPANQDLRRVRPAVRLAKEMGARLGAGQILLRPVPLEVLISSFFEFAGRAVQNWPKAAIHLASIEKNRHSFRSLELALHTSFHATSSRRPQDLLGTARGEVMQPCSKLQNVKRSGAALDAEAKPR